MRCLAGRKLYLLDWDLVLLRQALQARSGARSRPHALHHNGVVLGPPISGLGSIRVKTTVLLARAVVGMSMMDDARQAVFDWAIV